MGEQAAIAASPVRIPVSFWLNDQRVNGVLVAAHGTEKLVRYGGAGRLYVVTDRIPARKHFTESTIPPFWRKVIKGEDVDSAPPVKTKRRRVAGKERGGEGGQATLGSLPAGSKVGLGKVTAARVHPEPLPSEATADQEPATALDAKASADKINDRRGEGEMKTGEAKDLGTGNPATELVGAVKQVKVAKMGKAARAEKNQPAESGQVKASDLPQAPVGKIQAVPPEKKKRIPKEGNAKLPLVPADSVQIVCPYCDHSESLAVSPAVLEKPFFDTCKGCGKAFGVRVVPKTIYLAEVAGFTAS